MINEQQRVLEAVDEHGELGFIDLATKSAGAEANPNSVAVRLGNGTTVFVSPGNLKKIDTDKYKFAGVFEDLGRNTADQAPTITNQQNLSQQNLNQQYINHQQSLNQQSLTRADEQETNDGQIVIPLIAEEIQIGKRTVETGGVRIHKTVREDVQTIDEPIVREHLAVERVAINKFVETAPSVRYEGDTMIVPVLEEVVVTQKRLMLREEIRLTKSREEISNPQQIVLRREEINLEKIEPERRGQ